MTSVSIFPVLLMPAVFMLSQFGLHIPNPALEDPAADEARFNTVNGHLDMGGTVYAYISVDGDLTAIGNYLEGKLNEIRRLDQRAKVPPVDIPQLLQISGLDAVDAVGISSKRIAGGDGFRNKAYILAPNARQGLLRLLGEEPKPFDVVKLAPVGTDVAIEQEVNLKVCYEVALEVVGMLQGDEGRAKLEAKAKRPAGPFPFTLEKILADLDTQVTLVLDADPSWKIQIPGVKGAEIPQVNFAAMIDGLGWVVEEIAATIEKEFQGKEGRGKPPVAIIRGGDWSGLQLEIPQGQRIPTWAALLTTIGDSKPVFLHHKPSGKLVLASGKEFATKLFQEKPGLATDPTFQKTMEGLPTKGTGLSYVSPELFKIMRAAFANLPAPEEWGKGKDMFVAKTLLDLVFPEGLRGEGRVTTSTKEGILTVSNSSTSHKGKLASPMLMGSLPAVLFGLKGKAQRTPYPGSEVPSEHVHESEGKTER